MIRLVRTIVFMLAVVGVMPIISSCNSVQIADQVKEKPADVDRDDLALALIKQCNESAGSQRLKCTLELGEEYVKTYNATPKVLSRTVIGTVGNYDKVQYRIGVEKIVIRVNILEDNRSWLDKLASSTTYSLAALGLGLVVGHWLWPGGALVTVVTHLLGL